MKTFKLFVYPIPVLLLLGFIFDHQLEYATPSGSYGIGLLTLLLWVSGILLFSGIGYYLFREQELNRFLLHLHIWPTFIGLGYFILYALGTFQHPPSKAIAFCALMVGLGVVSYLINLTVGIISALLSQ